MRNRLLRSRSPGLAGADASNSGYCLRLPGILDDPTEAHQQVVVQTAERIHKTAWSIALPVSRADKIARAFITCQDDKKD
jgi:hypothetical protein